MENIRVYGTSTHEVDINPVHVIDEIISGVVGRGGWAIKRGDKYFRVVEHGRHHEEETEISKHSFKYYEALLLVKNELNKSRK